MEAARYPKRWFLTTRLNNPENHDFTLMVFESNALRRIFGKEMKKNRGKKEAIYDETHHNLYFYVTSLLRVRQRHASRLERKMNTKF